MNIDRLINMVVRMFMRKAVNKSFDIASDYAARRGKPEAEMTPEELAQAKRGKEMAKKARDVAKISRRL